MNFRIGVRLRRRFLYGHRATWKQWGGVAFDKPGAERERDYIMGGFYGLAAAAFRSRANDTAHRFVYGGIGQNLDRFSAFRLPGRRPATVKRSRCRLHRALPSTNCFLPLCHRARDLSVRGRLFLYPYIRGSYGLVEQARFQPDGSIRKQMDPMPQSRGCGERRSLASQSKSTTAIFGIYSDHGGGPPIAGGTGFCLLVQGVSVGHE